MMTQSRKRSRRSRSFDSYEYIAEEEKGGSGPASVETSKRMVLCAGTGADGSQTNQTIENKVCSNAPLVFLFYLLKILHFVFVITVATECGKSRKH